MGSSWFTRKLEEGLMAEVEILCREREGCRIIYDRKKPRILVLSRNCGDMPCESLVEFWEELSKGGST